MMPVIEQAMAMGYEGEQILSFLSNAFPKFKKGISDARRIGYQANDILKFLSGKMTNKKPSKEDLAPGERYLKESGFYTKEERQERVKKGLQTTLGAAGLAAGVGGLGMAAARFGAPIAYLGEKAVEGILGPKEPTPEGQSPVPSADSLLPEGPTSPPTDQQMQALQQEPARQTISQRLLEGVDLNALPEARKQPLQFLTMVADKLEAEGTSHSDPKMQGLIKKIRKLTTDKLSLAEEEEKKFKETYTPKEAITPDGDIATVLDQPGKTSKIDIDGQQKVFPTDKLIPIPENKDEILDLYERLIQAIPETDRSAVLNWVGFDPERKKLSVRFHSGDAYSYEDIPDEFVNKLENSGFLAKTTGGNVFGQWSEGEASRGAGLHKLIMELQKMYGGKGKEYSAKMKTVYSYLGPAEQKLKEKVAREKEARKKRKK